MLHKFFAAGAAALSGLAALATLLAPASAQKTDPPAHREWTMFGGTPSRNMVNLVDKDVPTEWDVMKKENVKWSARLGSRSYGGPIVVGGKVFIGTNNEAPRDANAKGDKGVLMCFDAATGKFLWQSVHDKLAAGRVNDWPREGLCSTPTVEGDYVYYVSNRCEVICARTAGLADGKNEGVTDEQYKGKTDADIVWRFDMIRNLNVYPHNMSSSCPLIVGDIIYVTTSNGVDEGHINLPSPEAPSFIAINKKTGKLLWRDSSPGRNIMHGQWSNATYLASKDRPQVLFPGGDGWLYSFDPIKGEQNWRFDANPKDSKYDLGGRGTRSDFISTPVFYKNKVYLGVGQDPEHNEGVGRLWCIDPTGRFDVSPDLVTDGKVFPPKTKPNPKSAAVWQFGGPVDRKADPKNKRRYYFGRTMSTCAIHDDLVYACDLGGYFCCLDAVTGKLYWDHDLQNQVWGSPYWVDNKIYIGNDDGVVHIFEHGKKKNLIGAVELDGVAIRSNPTVVDGVLYIMSGTNLYAIAEKK